MSVHKVLMSANAVYPLPFGAYFTRVNLGKNKIQVITFSASIVDLP
jgi:hypothetical protein